MAAIPNAWATAHIAEPSTEYKMYINGEWVDARDGARYDNYNPYTGEVFARS